MLERSVFWTSDSEHCGPLRASAIWLASCGGNDSEGRICPTSFCAKGGPRAPEVAWSSADS